MNIFEKINILLTESEGGSKVKESDIPIHPEMETREQGEISAAEKILKLFQKLSMGSGDKEEIKDGKPEIPDDMIDPMLKERPKSSKEKTFEKNKLAGWDETSDEKVKKEVDVNGDGDEDDEFDDFDYRKNPFGDEDNEDEMTEYDDDRTEDEKLKDSIDDAIDSLDDSVDEYGDGDEDDDSGADWGDNGDGDGDGGDDGDGEQGGESGQQGSKQSGQQGGEQNGESGESQSGDSNDGGKSSTKNGAKQDSKSDKRRRLEDLKKSLESGDMDDFNDTMEDIKNSTSTSNANETPGGQIETPSDEDFKKDMEKAGFDDKTIEEMTKKKNIDGNEDYSKEEMDELRKDVVNGLEDACKKKGGSALASTIVKNALKRKLNNDEWKEMLKVFLKAKSIGAGNMSTANKGIKWGHKNHLWREAVLPTDGPSKGTIQTIYCFVDFSGSVDQDLVYTFLGKVVDMCTELKYTKVNVYGFGERLSEPRVLDKRALKDGADVALSQTWDFISSQNPGPSTENFQVVAEEINKIKRKERDAVFLIFGDGYWQDRMVGPKSLKYDIMNEKYLNDICILAYYTFDGDRNFAGIMNEIREIVGIKHIITTKASSIHSK
jgi:hypothetical protein